MAFIVPHLSTDQNAGLPFPPTPAGHSADNPNHTPARHHQSSNLLFGQQYQMGIELI
jgi:hypothetical protein